jgi:prepilin-type N-terminal cleavage/methylation domain-containing protein
MDDAGLQTIRRRAIVEVSTKRGIVDWCARNSGAFTLVELVIVLLVTSIFAAAATPVFVNSLLFHRVESAARRVKADLEFARQTARLTSTERTFTVIGTTYSISPGVTSLDRPGQPYSVDLSKDPYRVSLSADFGGFTEVRFNGYGTPLKVNGTPLVQGTLIVQAARNHQCTVSLDGSSGQVTITSNHLGGRAAKVVE